MIPELGHFALILALVVALVQGILPLYGVSRAAPTWMAVAAPAALAQLLLVAVAFGCLTAAFIGNDFSVRYIAENSNSHLPLLYRISGVWGGHEGSLLLWCLLHGLWSGAVAWFSRDIPTPVLARVLAVLGLLSVGFLLFTLLTSNPFERLFPAPLEGRDLNPLLQDLGLAIHPPMLYMGYVGFSVAFGFAMAALMGGDADAKWARWARPWSNAAWAFLTIGIALGSWWAYYELGWGGWWFWDPVENASFMPWLAGTALLHSLAATEKRGAFKAWTLLLAVCAFALSLLGTFLVRSGVLTSVHAFANDPARGIFILLFLGVVVGSALGLYAWRAPRILGYARFSYLSRETAILINNLLLGTLCFVVLTGTLYPLVLDILGGAKISVGEPYFNFLFTIFGAPLILMLGFGCVLRWKQDRSARLGRRILIPAALSLGVGIALPWGFSHYSFAAAFGVTLGTWAITISVGELWARVGGAKFAQMQRRLAQIPRSIYGMSLAHIGIGVFVIGVTVTTAYSVENDLRMAPGEQFVVNNYAFRFVGVGEARGANYDALRGEFEVRRSANQGDPQTDSQAIIAKLYPEKRTYLVQKNPTTEAAIAVNFVRDLYVALGEPLPGEDAWAVRIYYKPLIRWIWLGALLMALGGLIAASDKRYRSKPLNPKTRLENLTQ